MLSALGLDSLLIRNAEKISQFSVIKQALLGRHEKFAGVSRILLGVVVKNIQGKQDYVTVGEDSVEGTGAGGNVSLKQGREATTRTSGRGTIGVCCFVLKLQVTPCKNPAVKVSQHVPFVSRVDSKVLEEALSWAKQTG